MKQKLLIIANNNIGSGQSGGDTIFLELIKSWQKKVKITVFGSEETKNLLKRYSISSNFIQSDKINPRSYPSTINIIHHTFRRIFLGNISFLTHTKIFRESNYCYTVSDFPPDFIFGLLYKIVNPKGNWLCGQYLFAPKPGSKYSPYHSQPIKGWCYYLFQQLTQFLAKHFADQILITSEPDRSRFPNKKIIVVQGGVDTVESEKYLKLGKIKQIDKRKYDAVFQGRLHPQKGVLELIDIWKLVTQKKPDAQLAIIGDGQLEKELRNKIKENKLTQNVTLFGFQSGQSKYNIFKDSKVVVHPAIYDSGGMAAAEAMAWGLPGVSFDLEALKTYYPQGMIKTPLGNYQIFADNVLKLLNNQDLYQKNSQQAVNLIRNVWDWSKRGQKIYHQIFHD